MKNLLLFTGLFVCLTAVTAFAQMGGHGGMAGHHDDSEMHHMSTQQSTHMMGGHMMNMQMFREMSGIMSRMYHMMQNMPQNMNMQRNKEMSSLMKEMSITMQEMSDHMAEGNMDTASAKKMEERMKAMNRIMDNMHEKDQ